MVGVSDSFSVEGQSVIITGSSQGIGRVTAERFAQEGADVVVSSRSEEKINEVVDGIEDSDAEGRAPRRRV
jgi:NAD(P)-dependent dehydrogenase (short-subunit alcohol dehydrogenase family)